MHESSFTQILPGSVSQRATRFSEGCLTFDDDEVLQAAVNPPMSFQVFRITGSRHAFRFVERHGCPSFWSRRAPMITRISYLAVVDALDFFL